MHNGIVPLVPQLNRSPSSLIQNRMPELLSGVSTSIHNPSVTNNHTWALRVQRNRRKHILQVHLHAHDLNLELDLLQKAHLVRLDEAPSLHHKRSCLWH